jgi:hypothetical protein
MAILGGKVSTDAIIRTLEKSVYDKEYVCRGIQDRLDVLKTRYYMYCSGVNEAGESLTPGGSAVARSKTKADIEILVLIDELIGHIEGNFTLSDDAGRGYERICEPYERHRNFRGA